MGQGGRERPKQSEQQVQKTTPPNTKAYRARCGCPGRNSPRPRLPAHRPSRTTARHLSQGLLFQELCKTPCLLDPVMALATPATELAAWPRRAGFSSTHQVTVTDPQVGAHPTGGTSWEPHDMNAGQSWVPVLQPSRASSLSLCPLTGKLWSPLPGLLCPGVVAAGRPSSAGVHCSVLHSDAVCPSPAILTLDKSQECEPVLGQIHGPSGPTERA